MPTQDLGGKLTLADDLTINRMGFGAMQLAGPGVFGQPADRSASIAVLKEAVALGIDHIDTSDFYGPYVVNELINEALFPYPKGLHIVTKVGAKRGEDGSWIHDITPVGLTAAVHANLGRLGLDALDVVNLRMPSGPDRSSPTDESLGEAFTALADLQQQGLIRHLGVSTITLTQLKEAQSIARVVTVQNLYNVANRQDDEMVDHCEREGIAYVPYFPLGGFTPIQSTKLDELASRLGVSSQQLALAWLLQRSKTIALIPGTSSVQHLHDNVAAASLNLETNVVEELNDIGQ